MSPLERIEFIDRLLQDLLAPLPEPGQPPGNRQQLHGELAQYWADKDSQGRSRRERLADLRRALMHAELDLRLADQTLEPAQAEAVRTCLDLPPAWQRRHHAQAQRPQVYRPVLKRSRPAMRTPLPGTFVIVVGAADDVNLDSDDTSGPALLCGLAQGIEAYPTLAALHVELCERLDDPIQGEPLLRLLIEPERIENARQADSLRYQWFADDPLLAQVDSLIEAQRRRLNQALATPPETPLTGSLERALTLYGEAGKQALLDTRYALLLEQHLPNWLRHTSPQGLSHIMQSMQRLIGAGNLAAAPGILTLRQFQQRHSLEAWTKARIEERLRHDLGLLYPASDIIINVVHTRQVGPHINPLQPSSYVTWRGSSTVAGKLIETYDERLPLDVLALRNIAWFDYDYWLTARVSHRLDKPLPAQLSPAYIKTLVRQLNVGGAYAEFLRSQLLDTPLGAWRLNAHVLVNRARMDAEATKARYAGHLGRDHDERDYRWIRQVLEQPHNALRSAVDGQRITVRQLTLRGHTLQGVLLIHGDAADIRPFVLYTPDAPDRRAWRSLANTRELLRLLRRKPELRAYVANRLPLWSRPDIERALLKGRLGPVVRTQEIGDDLFFACYRAEVHALLASVDAITRTTAEVNLQQVIDYGWRLLDLICTVLPAKVLIPLAMGRMALEIWDSADAFQEADIEGILQHLYNVMSFANDITGSLGGTGMMRRVLRGLPSQPPLPLPVRYSVVPVAQHLRFRIDGIYGEGVYEMASEFEGLSQYFIQDAQRRQYKVAFDGRRWRVIDPTQPDAYQEQPIKRLTNGGWVIDSPVLWYDGLPDLQALLDHCRQAPTLQGTPSNDVEGLYQAAGQLYLHTQGGQLPLRRHLLPRHFHLPIPGAAEAGVIPWAILRWQDAQWRIRVRQAGRSSDWLTLPGAYASIRGNRRSKR